MRQGQQKSKDFVKACESWAGQKGYQLDVTQKHVLSILNQFANQLLYKSLPWWCRLWSSRPASQGSGVYIWGGVGRGKTLIMQRFFEYLPDKLPKVRWHFHEFMQRVHADLAQYKYKFDPLKYVAIGIAKQYQLICLDELHIVDIADAMLIQRLFKILFAQGVQVVMTSNDCIERLYYNGLHRDRFLPTITLFKSALQSIQIDVGVDYRHREQTGPGYIVDAERFPACFKQAFIALSGCNAQFLDENCWHGSAKSQFIQLVDGRKVAVVAQAKDIVWCTFEQLCAIALSQRDYLSILKNVRVLMLSALPSLDANYASELRRLVWLVDVLYDQGVLLLCAGHLPLQKIFIGHGENLLPRAQSRLLEMSWRCQSLLLE